jgi:hypothetical protein
VRGATFVPVMKSTDVGNGGESFDRCANRPRFSGLAHVRPETCALGARLRLIYGGDARIQAALRVRGFGVGSRRILHRNITEQSDGGVDCATVQDDRVRRIVAPICRPTTTTASTRTVLNARRRRWVSPSYARCAGLDVHSANVAPWAEGALRVGGSGQSRRPHATAVVTHARDAGPPSFRSVECLG